MRLVVVLLLALPCCKYISDPRTDPAEPLVFSIYNQTETAYLALSDGGSVLDGALRLAQNDEPFRGALGCAGLCSDGCGVVACSGPQSVHVLAPGQGLIAEWTMMRFDDGSMV